MMHDIQKLVNRGIKRKTLVAENRMVCFGNSGDVKDIDEAEKAYRSIIEICNSQLVAISAVRSQL